MPERAVYLVVVRRQPALVDAQDAMQVRLLRG